MTWQIKLISILLVLTIFFAWHKYDVHKAVTENTQKQTAIYKKQIDKLTIKSLKVESELKTQVSVLKGEKDAKIKSIDAKYRSALDSLLQYKKGSTKSYSSRDSSNAESASGTTPEGLLARHEEVSLGIARDAEKLKAELIQCYAQYDSVRDSLNNYRK